MWHPDPTRRQSAPLSAHHAADQLVVVIDRQAEQDDSRTIAKRET